MNRIALLTACCLATPALAQVDDGQANWNPNEEKIRHVEIGVTLLGFVNGSFLDEPSDKDKTATLSDGSEVVLLYPGFGGVGGGGGLTVNAMWRGIVGLETGALFVFEQGAGTLNIGGTLEVDYTLGQNAVHVPLLLKVAAPLQTMRPFGYFGIEWAFVSDAEVQKRDPDSAAASALVGVEADDYWLLAFGAGFEFMIPAGVDLRIPLTFRGAWNPNVGDKASDRMRTVPEDCGSRSTSPCTQFVYSTEWQYQAAVSLGLAYYFM